MAPLEVVERVRAALNAHDLEALIECFDENYLSEQPLHPGGPVNSREQVRATWAEIFRDVPNLAAEVVAAAGDGDTLWIEWRMHGTRDGGTPFEIRGVVINGIRNDRIVWARVYLGPVEHEGHSLAQTIQLLSRR